MYDVLEKDVRIENMIYEINGIQVMTAFDLAILYQCKNGTKEINQAVKNNIEKFPDRYSWILNDNDSNNFLVKNFDQKNVETRGGRYRNQRVFTEEGVAMLATVLHTKVATKVSIGIMDAFVKMRHLITDNKDIYKSISNINNTLIEHNDKINYLFSKFDKKEELFLKGEVYDAYSSFVSIFKKANNELIIIDSYADNTLLDIIRKLKCSVILITKNSDRLTEKEIQKYNEEYHNLKVFRNNSFHDRYFVIDNKTIYQSGSSINNAGEKIFSINKLEDNAVKNIIISCIKEIIGNQS